MADDALNNMDKHLNNIRDKLTEIQQNAQKDRQEVTREKEQKLKQQNIYNREQNKKSIQEVLKDHSDKLIDSINDISQKRITQMEKINDIVNNSEYKNKISDTEKIDYTNKFNSIIDVLRDIDTQIIEDIEYRRKLVDLKYNYYNKKLGLIDLEKKSNQRIINKFKLPEGRREETFFKEDKTKKRTRQSKTGKKLQNITDTFDQQGLMGMLGLGGTGVISTALLGIGGVLSTLYGLGSDTKFKGISKFFGKYSIKGVLKTIKTFFGKTMNIFKKMMPKNINKYFDDMTKFINKLNPFKQLSNMVSKFLKSSVSAGGKAISKALGKIGSKKLLGLTESIGSKIMKSIGKRSLGAIPFIGSLFNIGFGIDRLQQGDLIGGVLEFASGIADFIPVPGFRLVGIGLDAFLAIRDIKKGGVKESGQQIKEFFGKGKDVISNMIDKVGDFIGNIFSIDFLKNVPVLGDVITIYNSLNDMISGNIEGGLNTLKKHSPAFMMAYEITTGLNDIMNQENNQENMERKKINMTKVSTNIKENIKDKIFDNPLFNSIENIHDSFEMISKGNIDEGLIKLSKEAGIHGSFIGESIQSIFNLENKNNQKNKLATPTPYTQNSLSSKDKKDKNTSFLDKLDELNTTMKETNKNIKEQKEESEKQTNILSRKTNDENDSFPLNPF